MRTRNIGMYYIQTFMYIGSMKLMEWDFLGAQWLRCCATNQKVAGSIPDGAIGIFH